MNKSDILKNINMVNSKFIDEAERYEASNINKKNKTFKFLSRGTVSIVVAAAIVALVIFNSNSNSGSIRKTDTVESDSDNTNAFVMNVYAMDYESKDNVCLIQNNEKNAEINSAYVGTSFIGGDNLYKATIFTSLKCSGSNISKVNYRLVLPSGDYKASLGVLEEIGEDSVITNGYAKYKKETSDGYKYYQEKEIGSEHEVVENFDDVGIEFIRFTKEGEADLVKQNLNDIFGEIIEKTNIEVIATFTDGSTKTLDLGIQVVSGDNELKMQLYVK